MQEIYFDNAATTKTLEESARIAYEIMVSDYGNPSSVHGKGFAAEKLLKAARLQIMAALGADERSYTLTFTASGTESDNLAVLGTAKLLTKRGNRILMGNSEHPAVFECRAELEKLGYEVLLIPNVGGKIDFDFVRENLTNKTVLITHMLVNNETGALYDIKKLCRIRDELSPKCLVHTDAVQGFLKTEKKLATLGADLISVSSHKIHAPKGVGALLCKKGVRIAPIICGGGQEGGLRSGTESLPLICAFANSAAVLSKSSADNLCKVSELRHYLKEKIQHSVSEAVINEADSFTPYILSVSIPGIRSEIMLRFLSERGIYVSAGSACSSKHKENRVLANFGVSPALADSTIRISFSEFNTQDEADALVEGLSEGYKSLAKIKK